jgi:predicted nucleotidyltransferase
MATREDVAREAARLLYERVHKEYKDAKEAAAASLGTRSLPSNYEVALELDRLTEEKEGSDRLTRLIEMRQIAVMIMKDLEKYDPTLIGSVWRGTPRKGSDIDIVVFKNDWRTIVDHLSQYILVAAESVEFILDGVPRRADHIELRVNGHLVEVVVRPPEDRAVYDDERCETFGDIKKGLRLNELERLMRSDPLRRFIPKRRYR